METERFNVNNVKCAGCVSAIQNGLKDVPGVTDVVVDIEGGLVTVHGSQLSREVLSSKLSQLGYPER